MLMSKAVKGLSCAFFFNKYYTLLHRAAIPGSVPLTNPKTTRRVASLERNEDVLAVS